MTSTATNPDRHWRPVSEKPSVYETLHAHAKLGERPDKAEGLSGKQKAPMPSATATQWSSPDWNNVALLTVVTLFVRLFMIHHPSMIIFDEVHFGGFALHYLGRQYYTDVHPPLAKMLVALTAWLGQLDLNFRFKLIGIDYTEGRVPFILMRLVPALLGSAMVPLAYVTLRAFGLGRAPCLWTSALVLFDNAFTTQFRFILLDAYLAFGTAAALASYALFRAQRQHPFGLAWWLCLAATGFWLGFTLSCKWIGLFAVATVGLFTALDVWHMFADQSVSIPKWGLQFMARLGCLVGIPLLVYMASFYAHFAILSHHGVAGGQMSVEFQQGLLDRPNIEPTFIDVGYGSIITLRHQIKRTSYLHSHNHFYPSGSKQQQVTLYDFSDENSQWRVLPSQRHGVIAVDSLAQFVPLRHNDVIRLEHIATGRFLHSHTVEPPLSDKEHHFEVSCYGAVSQNIGDTNDHWRIELTDQHGNPVSSEQAAAQDDARHGLAASRPVFASLKSAWKAAGQAETQAAAEPVQDAAASEEEPADSEPSSRVSPPVLARQSSVRLVHVNTGARLCTFGKKLPSWGSEQGEVTASRDALRRNSVWRIDSNKHPLLALDAPKVSYPTLSFFEKFVELNQLMWNLNSGLTESHYFASRPESWFTLRRGLGFWNGGQQGHRRNATVTRETQDDGRVLIHTFWEPGNYLESAELKSKNRGSQIYLLGNPITWWWSSAAIMLYVVFLALLVLTERRGLAKVSLHSDYRITNNAGLLWFGWAFHFFPFFLMKRQLFLHHYLPAYYFGIMLLGYLTHGILSLIFSPERGYMKRLGLSRETCLLVFYSLTLSIVVAVFLQFSPLGYGLPITRERCLSLQWLSTWDFDCESMASAVLPSSTA